LTPTRHFQCRTFGRSVTSPKGKSASLSILKRMEEGVNSANWRDRQNSQMIDLGAAGT
jgi:hypothetical protein